MAVAARNDVETLFKSEAYASSFKRGEIVTRTFAELLVDQSKVCAESKANPDQPLVILDNACGTGVISSILNDKVDGIVKKKWKLTCGDISPAVLAYTEHRMQQEGWENAETKLVDAQKPDLPSDYYSHIFSSFVYMALPESLKALDETVRMLQPGGTIAFSTWMLPGSVSIARGAIESMPGNLPFPEVEKMVSVMTDGHWHSKPWIESQLEERGFQEIDVCVRRDKLTLTPSIFLEMTMLVLPIMVMSFWTEEQRKENADKVRPALERYLEDTFGDDDIETEWVAILSTARKSR
ncbi:uncharacterized protein N7515_007854 [Penicillium bovifimosum]|uniref:Methyltransferase domain-containing protein n=1 Tax=Penicillium bovifimosum TaxID=126998 RepID=A0A9W9KVS4_9EURO|nr:uncharacterized protein N7515_007854 [Penicillium bovifimosum]KAJ5124029.1 hypothetical protein N7515_007854 [Penicillium bovifimosum]